MIFRQLFKKKTGTAFPKGGMNDILKRRHERHFKKLLPYNCNMHKILLRLTALYVGDVKFTSLHDLFSYIEHDLSNNVIARHEPQVNPFLQLGNDGVMVTKHKSK